MADYLSSTGRSKMPLYLGIGAVGLVIIIGLFALGGGGVSDLDGAQPVTESIAPPPSPDPATAPN